ncbi:hypothetical protein BVG79_p1000217 (plasmid) [Ketogulonicigenium robustum]|uniref:Uncharacterized protein n=1 Tax=Ketogulonicigenium robustum TaxID=92947 RepID=A0A1W6P3L9_9RHOB|nr:hypothetical protein BVG79_p1000217 [Ketogulonicigenium robustum]
MGDESGKAQAVDIAGSLLIYVVGWIMGFLEAGWGEEGAESADAF